jgi:hypothetical protein
MRKFNTIQQMVDEAYGNSKDHGFHADDETPETVPFAEKIALIHSEITEAFDDFEGPDRRLIRFEDDGKPCGAASELADVVIRVFDLAGSMGLRMGPVGISFDGLMEAAKSKEPHWKFNLNASLMQVHRQASIALEMHRVGLRSMKLHVESALYELVTQVAGIAVGVGVDDFHAAMEQKMAYNRTRPVKHGKLY